MGTSLERALCRGAAPAALQAAAAALLPERFRDSIGWGNLTGLPPRLLTLLIERADPVVQAFPPGYRFWRLAHFLWFHRHSPWVEALAAVAAALLREDRPGHPGLERNSPVSILNTVKRVCRVLEAVFSGRGLQCLADVRGADVIAYARGDYGGPCTSNRSRHVDLWRMAVDAQARLLRAFPSLAGVLAPWLLPPLPAEQEGWASTRRARAEEEARRKTEIDALMPMVLPLLRTMLGRTEVCRALRVEATKARHAFDERGGTPVPFDVNLADNSARLHFRMVSAVGLDRESAASNWQSRKKLKGRVLTEYLGATVDGVEAERGMPFFVALQRAWYDPAERPPLQQLGVRETDLLQCRPGLFRIPWYTSYFFRRQVQTARERGCASRILFDTDALCAGVAFGSLLVAVSLHTGLRTHEQQQFRLDGGFTGLNADGQLLVMLFPKSCKEPMQPRTHVLSALINPLWLEVLDLQKHLWSGQATLWPENGAEMGLRQGKYLFQTAGKALFQSHIQSLMRLVLTGHPIRTPSGTPVLLTTHKLRHAYARVCKELGYSTELIQRAMGHRSADVTRTYMGGPAGQGPRYLTPLEPDGTLWNALLIAPGEQE